MYIYKNGMRFLANKKSYIKLGKERKVSLKIEGKVGTCEPISYNLDINEVKAVTLNKFKLTPRIDFVIDLDKKTILFTFNLRKGDVVGIEGSV